MSDRYLLVDTAVVGLWSMADSSATWTDEGGSEDDPYAGIQALGEGTAASAPLTDQGIRGAYRLEDGWWTYDFYILEGERTGPGSFTFRGHGDAVLTFNNGARMSCTTTLGGTLRGRTAELFFSDYQCTSPGYIGPGLHVRAMLSPSGVSMEGVNVEDGRRVFVERTGDVDV